MAAKKTETWQEKIPRNNAVCMRLDPETAQELAYLAWQNEERITQQAKIIFAIGLEAYKGGARSGGREIGKAIEWRELIKNMIKDVHDYLDDEQVIDGRVYSHIADEAECQEFVVNAVMEAMA